MFLTVVLSFVILFSTDLLDSLKNKSLIDLSFDNTVSPSLSNADYIAYIMVETPDDSLWFFVENEAWILDRNTLKWRFVAPIQLEDHQITGGYDPIRKEFLFWSTGIGKVYTWKPGQIAPIRVDKSDNHKTQYSHYPMIDPSTGNIFAFGGGGYWQTRGYISKFDQGIKEWSIVPINNSTYPSSRMAARGAYDSRNKQLHIFGGYDYRFSRADLSNDAITLSDYWIFDFGTSYWVEKKILNTPPEIEFYPNAYEQNFASLSIIDDENRLIWYLVNTNVEQQLQLVVYDIERSFGAFLPVYIPFNHKIQYEFDEKNNRLLIYHINISKKNDEKFLLKIQSLNLPNPQETRLILDEISQNEKQLLNPVSNNINLIILSLLPLALITTWYFYNRKKRIKSSNDQENTNTRVISESILDSKSQDSVVLEVNFVGEKTISIQGAQVSHLFTRPELELFLWLFWKMHIGKLYQTTDSIEEVFWSDVQNQDYVRKQRNLSLKKLNKQLQTLFEKHLKRDLWVLDRNAYNDKRKKEYALNLAEVNVICDLDKKTFTSEDILKRFSGKWVTHIRSEYNIWSTS